MRNWPRPGARTFFELYYVEGLDPEEIAMVTSQSLKRVRKDLESIQCRLRNEIRAQKNGRLSHPPLRMLLLSRIS